MIGHLLTQSVKVYRAEVEDDGAGGQEETWHKEHDLSAKIDESTADEAERASKWEAKHTHSIYFESDSDVKRGDELREGEQTYLVISTTRPSRNAYLKAECENREAEGDDGSESD